MKDPRDVTCLVVDNGLFVEFAAKLAQVYKKVYYHVPSTVAFPKINPAMIGYGYPGLELVTDPWGPFFEEVDLFCFPDIGFGQMQEYLESIGKTVFGSRMGEELELDRVATKELMKELGLPVGKYAVVKGTEELRKYLKGHNDQYVKVDKWRGTFESFYAKDYRSIETKLDEVEWTLGAFKYIMEFVCEDALPDCIEFGTDLWTVDGRYPVSILSGFEIKNICYLGVFKPFDELPEPFTRWNKAIAPILQAYRYRGPLSCEVRVGRDKKPYMIDATCRLPSPPNELYQEFYTNIGEIVWAAANGLMVEPVPIAKYGAQVTGMSGWAEKNWQPIDFPESIRRHVKLHNGALINGRYYSIPQVCELKEVCCVIGWGDSPEAAVDMVKDLAVQVEGYEVEFNVEAFDKADQEVEAARQFGLEVM